MKTPEQIAEAIIQRANDGYHNQPHSGYPRYALSVWDDRIRWSEYIKKVAASVIAEEIKPKRARKPKIKKPAKKKRR
jgi:hypothetical protein